jgi:hypothetical protein
MPFDKGEYSYTQAQIRFPKPILQAKGSVVGELKSEVLAFWHPTTVQATQVQSPALPLVLADRLAIL